MRKASFALKTQGAGDGQPTLPKHSLSHGPYHPEYLFHQSSLVVALSQLNVHEEMAQEAAEEGAEQT